MHIEIEQHEDVLRIAMLTSDVAALDALIADDLAFCSRYRLAGGCSPVCSAALENLPLEIARDLARRRVG